MAALDQYLDLYENHKALVDTNGCLPMNKIREKALNVLKKEGLPKKGSENYETIDLDCILSPDFGLNLARIEIDANPQDAFHQGVPSLGLSPFFQINDIIKEKKEGLSHKGLWIGSAKNFYALHPEIMEKYYGKLADIKNPLVALNSLFVQDGLVIWVRGGTKVEKPVQLVNILHNGAPLMAVRRLLIILEKDAELKVLSCDHSQANGVKFFNLQTIEIFADKKSKLDFYDLEEADECTSRLSSLYLSQEAESDVLINGITLNNGITRNEYYSVYNGEKASFRLFGMGIEDEERELHTFSKIEHKADACITDELFKYVLEDKSVGSFAGLIKVMQGALKTEAYQSSRNIVGSDEARMYSKPQLEIYDDDVKCSHGCTIGRLDELQIFYMQTRGIPEEKAKFLLKQAFMEDIIDKVSIPGLKERLKILIEKRFAGEHLNCAICKNDCRIKNIGKETDE